MRERKRHIHQIVQNYKPFFLLLFETHSLVMRIEKFWDNLGINQDISKKLSATQGAFGFLRPDRISHAISLTLWHMLLPFLPRNPILSGSVKLYMPPIPIARSVFWEYLIQSESTVQGRWLMLGDFNDIILSLEVSEGIF